MNRASRYALAALILLPAVVETQEKRILDHDAYEIWKGIEDQAISNDGRWVLYRLTLQDGDAELVVSGLTSDATYSIPRGASPRFTEDSRYVATLVNAEKAALRAPKQQNKQSEQQPKDSLALLDLSTGAISKVERVKSFRLPQDGGGWVAYLLEGEIADTGAAEPGEQGGQGEQEVEEGGEVARKKRDNEIGTTLVLRNLSSGAERRYESVTEYAFSDGGERLVYAASNRDGSADGVMVVQLESGAVTPLMTGEGIYKSAVFDEAGDQVAFLSNRDDYQADQPEFSLYHWRSGQIEPSRVAGRGTAGIPAGWWVSERGDLSFSQSGARVFFATAPIPEPEVKDSTPDGERVKIDVWHWRDPLLQPMQLLQVERERNRTYSAVLHLRNGRVVQLATLEVPTVSVGQEGDADLALGTSNLRYRLLTSWDSPGYNDVYLVNVNSGERWQVIEALQGNASLSPNGEYVFWWDRVGLAWYASTTDGTAMIDLTSRIPYPLFNEDHDLPSSPPSYGYAGWTEADEEFLVYDRYDVWAVDPEGRKAPRNVTDEQGRSDSLRFRLVQLDPEAEFVSRSDPMLLAAFDLQTKDAGFYDDRVGGDEAPELLLSMARRFSSPTKARDANVLLFTRSSVEEFPDLWVSNLDFTEMRRVSDANAQQSEYLWATVELVQWLSADGRPLQGLLYKPEDFDPVRQYPMIVYFYERESDNLHVHYDPIPHRSVIRPTFYASRGYLVFVPDIVYQVGYPGESAMKCVMPGVLQLIDQGYVDQDNIGVQGHSWGGYQIAYMVTKTDLFKAAAGGAPVSNMTSAYGGIRWSSGMSRMFQYEKTQSRIGATLWEAPMRYIENSPIFWADKVETPLLMLHNDHDGAVPWYQGIEMFVALRRLGKPAWLINYNDEPHWPTTYANKRDWNIRLQQYFDHYLKGAPAPVWLAEGIPAIAKGKTLGLELVGEGTTASGQGGR
jgi:dipeptidyl aminopeptidase/acylaminoacyl peptidase